MTQKMYKGKTYEQMECPMPECGRPIRAENSSLHGHFRRMHPSMSVRERSVKVQEILERALEKAARGGSDGET